MKAITIQIGGKERYLAFTGEAMFTVREQYGSAEALLDATKPDTREGFSTLCAAVAILAEQGELARRYFGYAPDEILTAADVQRVTTPADIIPLKLALPRAITLGYGREIEPENNEVDLGLAELNQKKRPNPGALSPHGDGLRIFR